MIHTFQKYGLNLVLDTGSGAVHLPDNAAYALLCELSEQQFKEGRREHIPAPLLEQYGASVIYEAFDELRELITQEVLFVDDSYSEFADQLGTAPIKAMCLHIAHDCNLRCQYCFAATGDFGGEREFMSAEVAKNSIDMLISLSGERVNLEVDFFGGEPLMNFDVVRQTVDYARSIEKKHGKNFRFTITTNGVALNNDIIEYINREMSNVVLSLDGRKEINDAMRPTPGGKGSYDTIVPKYQKLISKRMQGPYTEYYVRGTYTRHNVDFHNDVLAMVDLGFDQISVEPATGSVEENYAIQFEHLEKIQHSYDALAEELIKRHQQGRGVFNFFHFMLDLENGPCAIKRLKGCGSGNEYIAVTPKGELYPCHQFVGIDEFLMGTLQDGIQKPTIKEEFSKAHIQNKPECVHCWAKLFCSGGCNANNHLYAGHILRAHELSCELEKMRLECAIAIKAKLALLENV